MKLPTELRERIEAGDPAVYKREDGATHEVQVVVANVTSPLPRGPWIVRERVTTPDGTVYEYEDEGPTAELELANEFAVEAIEIGADFPLHLLLEGFGLAEKPIR